MKMATQFSNDLTDSALEDGLLRLPKEDYQIRHDILLQKLKDKSRHSEGYG